MNHVLLMTEEELAFTINQAIRASKMHETQLEIDVNDTEGNVILVDFQAKKRVTKEIK